MFPAIGFRRRGVNRECTCGAEESGAQKDLGFANEIVFMRVDVEQHKDNEAGFSVGRGLKGSISNIQMLESD